MISRTSTDTHPFDDAWRERAEKDLGPQGRELLHAAVAHGAEALSRCHADTGEPLDVHAAGVAGILADIGADAEARAAAILTMLPSTNGQPGAELEQLRKAFGPSVATLVQGARSLLRLGNIAGTAVPDRGPQGQDQKEMRRKMLLAMAADLRIVVLRLASRLQSLRWHAASKTPYPTDLTRETMELYTPLANRLGIWQLKWEMEDLAFRFLEPETYKAIAKQLESKRTEREALIAAAVKHLQEVLADAHISGRVYGRPKHIYSIWNKMRNKRVEFHELYDLRALRVIVADERSCYAALALVHSLWTPVPDEFDDYISRPKPNGYRSLHTVVADEEGRTFEIQIRTEEMHRYAEYGMAAHWLYKESGSRGGQVAAASGYDQKLAWMRQLLSWESGAPAADAAPTPNPQEERIYVMTPQARVIELPAGATPVDFAYHLHTDLGHRCRGARVNGQMVPLSTPLHTGEIVEIIAAKSGGPSRDWLNVQLGFLASPRARAKVRAWFNAIELQQRIGHGQGLVEKELQRLGKTAVNMEQLAQQLGFAHAEDLYVAVSKEEFSLRQIDYVLSGQKARDEQAQHDDAARMQQLGSGTAAALSGKSGVLVVGVDSLLTQLARCCRPAPPDRISGFVTRGRGVSIHRNDCPSYASLIRQQPERAIEVEWGDTGDTLYPVDISIHAQERPNLLRDLSEVFAKLRLNVVSVNTHSRRSLAHMVFTIEVRSGEQTARIITALNELPGVEAQRV